MLSLEHRRSPALLTYQCIADCFVVCLGYRGVVTEWGSGGQAQGAGFKKRDIGCRQGGDDTRMDARWNFDNTYVKLPEKFYTKLSPTPVPEPRLVLLNEPLADELGLDVAALRSGDGVHGFAGNKVPTGSEPIAQAYAGHQFGYFTKLGDGRAIVLGEHVTPSGDRFDIQLKGSGPTPYSRGGDGRAALGPMLREYIISEAMHGLGIPTTRSLAVVTTGDTVIRERILPGAVLTRVAASHLRVGTFQYAAFYGMPEDLRALADYTLQRHFPEIDPESPTKYLQLLQRVVERQIDLVVRWQLVGFVHGVMNTDNVTISGETIDYGPCAFMDLYDPETVFSSIDRDGRYAYGNQPRITAWNLARFADTLLPLIDEDEVKAIEQAQEVIAAFPDLYRERWLAGMRAKLGLRRREHGDRALADELLHLMQSHGADFTNTFRALTIGRTEPTPIYTSAKWMKWYDRWRARAEREGVPLEQVRARMREANPAVIPRNHRVEEALAAAVDDADLKPLQQLLAALKDPYAYSSQQELYAATPEPSPRPYVTYCGT